MNFKNVSWILPLFLAVSCSQTPSLNTNPTASSKILGTVSLGIGSEAESSSVHISPRAALPDKAITFGLPTFVTYNDGATRYLSATFPITNTTATAFTNLTFHAYNKNGSGIGGTAVENMINFNGGATASNAQSLLPIHKTDAVGLPPVPTIDSNNADFQAFNVDEIATLTTQALALAPRTITASDTILQYGFVARNAAGGRAILANGGTGTVTIAYKLPDGNVNAAYKFKADFVLADDTANTRVTRGLDEPTSAADARATAITADEVFLVGNDTDTTTNASQRVTNILTSSSPVCLQSALACSLTTTVVSTGTGLATTLAAYSIGITATPAAGTALTTVDIDWGDTFTESPALPVISASHTYAVIGTYTITITATDSNGDTGTEIKTVSVL